MRKEESGKDAELKAPRRRVATATFSAVNRARMGRPQACWNTTDEPRQTRNTRTTDSTDGTDKIGFLRRSVSQSPCFLARRAGFGPQGIPGFQRRIHPRSSTRAGSQSIKILVPCEDFIRHQNILLSGRAQRRQSSKPERSAAPPWVPPPRKSGHTRAYWPGGLFLTPMAGSAIMHLVDFSDLKAMAFRRRRWGGSGCGRWAAVFRYVDQRAWRR